MKRTWMILGCALALGMGLTACDDGGTPDPTDSGVTPEEDGSMMMMEDSGPGPSTPVVMAFDGTDEVPADLSCRGSRTAPTGSGASTFTATADNFGASGTVDDLTVQFFPDNMPTADGTCTGTCQEVTTGPDGAATFMGEAGAWYAYRILAGEGQINGGAAMGAFVQVVQVNEIAPDDGGNTSLNAVSMSTLNTFTALLSVSQDATNGLITGQSFDCMGRPLVNANVRVFDDSGQIPFGTSRGDTKDFYFSGSQVPQASARRTAADGLYGASNIPIPADGTIRVGIYGTLEEGGAQELIGCETVRVDEGTITILNVGPERSDGPSGCE